MPTLEPVGFPPAVEAFEAIDRLGRGCRIGAGVTVFRAMNPFANAGIFLGDEVTIFDGVRLLLGEIDTRLVIGDRVVVNIGAYLSGEGGLIIGDDVMIGPRANLLSAGHGIHGGDPVIARNPITYGEIRIGKGAWIAAGATVLQGVSIGEGAVVAAASVVTASVPPFAIVAGNPARVVRMREGFGSEPRRRRFWLRRKDASGES